MRPAFNLADLGFGNLHTHTTFCDGADTPAAMAAEARRLGCDYIGFSGHSYTFFDDDYCMSPAAAKAYREEVARLKRFYDGQMRVYCGVEQDFYSDEPSEVYDYVIGAVHYVLRDGAILPIDLSVDDFAAIVRDFYAGDAYALAEDYYKTLSQVVAVTHCDIVAHFDLVTKYNEGGAFFDETHPRYRAASAAALSALLSTGVAFEINTGAISRGYRHVPYLPEHLAERVRAAGRTLIVTSDAHCKEDLLFGLPRTRG